MNQLVVAANNNEDTAWTENIKDWNIEIFTHYRPAGRETDTYLGWIINNYSGDWDEVAFLQGDPFFHDQNVLWHLSDPRFRYYGPIESCDPHGMPRIEWAMLDEWCKVLGLKPQLFYLFVAGAQYRLTKEQVTARPIDLYHALYWLTKIPADQKAWPGTGCPQNPSAYTLERLWPVIWNITLP